jgi:hypothetical protein
VINRPQDFEGRTPDGTLHRIIDITQMEDAVDVLVDSFFCFPCTSCLTTGCACCSGAGFHYAMSAS